MLYSYLHQQFCLKAFQAHYNNAYLQTNAALELLISHINDHDNVQVIGMVV